MTMKYRRLKQYEPSCFGNTGVQHLGACCAFYTCGPCLPFKYLYRRIRKKRKEAKEKRENELRELPPIWPAPLDAKTENGVVMEENMRKKAVSQLQCPLFKLPLEIRLLIYGMVLGGEVSEVHVLSRVYGKLPRRVRLRAFLCEDQNAAEEGRMCDCVVVGSDDEEKLVWDREIKHYRRRRVGIMGLLLSCRLLYVDAVQALYRYPTFQFQDLQTIILFSRQIPQRHFESIRSVHLNTSLLGPNTSFSDTISTLPPPYEAAFSLLPSNGVITPYDSPSTWQAVCHLLSTIPCLRALEIQLSGTAFSGVLFSFVHNQVPTINEDFIFSPLMEIGRAEDEGGQQLERFEVNIDWIPEVGNRQWDTRVKPFVLTRQAPRQWGV